jgi:hypothetical protein
MILIMLDAIEVKISEWLLLQLERKHSLTMRTETRQSWYKHLVQTDMISQFNSPYWQTSAWEGGKFMNFQCMGLVLEIVTLYVEQMWVHTYVKKHQLLWQVFFLFSIANVIDRSFSGHVAAGLWTCKQSTAIEDHHFYESRTPFMGLGAIFLTFFCIGRWKRNQPQKLLKSTGLCLESSSKFGFLARSKVLAHQSTW